MQRPGPLVSYVMASSTLLSGAAFAQGALDAYPSRPVTGIVAQVPGGASTNESRLYMNKMGELTGQQFVLDFKPGAGTTIGAAYVAKSRPDGYTLLVVTQSFAVSPSFYRDLPYDSIKDFSPLSLMSQRISMLMVHPAFPAKSFSEYLAFAKTNPGKINFGALGGGSATHLAGAWLHNATNTEVTFVQYKGTVPLMLDLVAGRLDATPATLLAGLQLMKTGKLRALAIMSDKRTNLLPTLGTVAELGVPGYNYPSWLGFSAPAGTPAPIANKLSETFARVAKMPDIAAPLEAEGSLMLGTTAEQFRQAIVKEIAQWKRLVQETGIKLEE